jgi:hypothetical protein
MSPQDLVVQFASEKRSYVTRQIGGETLIVPVTGSVADLESIYVLNEVGSRIWDLLRTPTTVHRIAEVVAREFTVSPEGAAADVLTFLDTLDSRGLIQRLTESA